MSRTPYSRSKPKKDDNLSEGHLTLMEGISFESEEVDGLPSAAIDKYIGRQERMATEREAALGRAEAAQVRIKELLDALG